MSLRLGAIADDYTGASDLANTLTRNGLRTVQTIGVPADDLVLPDVDAVVIALKSRSIPAAEAVEKSLAACRWLEARGAGHILFKVCSTFDSTDEGNIGPVTDALRQATGEVIVLVTPAFPETGRTLYQGNLFVAGVPLAESPMKDHPLNPMRDSDLRRVLARQSEKPVGLIPLATVAAGDGAVGQRLAALAGEGFGAAIADAVFDADLEILGRAALRQRLSVGASGLGLGLARALADGPPMSAAAPFEALGGPAACLAGSCSAATLRQITAAEATMPVLRLDAEALLAKGGAVEKAIAWASTRLADGPVLVASSASPDAVAALQARHGGAVVGTAIEAAFAEIAAGLVALGVRRLVVAGGETSGAVVDRLGLSAFALGPEIAPGVPVLRSLGGTDMRLALKSGNFGGPDFFRDALSMMP
ncbi:3-oxo-tetronate kinase [Aureimonas glaciei]|uniref:3-oxo-tetronate kinase n=1 Tax=Aureimonas glaciei TaxID=1776957 RepID=A0A917DFE8_9HYPH|nr:3-oxo-tetronate kinase [Aureimonas glaciei]GGD33239.1 HPr kinase [Aureimonas glaciei]